jgi:large subunit ribosomal protein L25
MAETKLVAKMRDKTGKGASRKYRVDGWIPVEFYSSRDENVHLLLPSKEYEKTLIRGHGLFNLELEGQEKNFQCIIKELQIDPVKGTVLHADFQGVKLGEKIVIKVPLIVLGTSAGVKAGGIMEFIIREVQVECLPTEIPEKLEIDVSALNIGDSIRIKDLKFENIVILDDPEEAVLLVEHPKIAKEFEEVPETVEVAAPEEPQEPEVIRARRKEEDEEEEKKK